MPGCDGAGTAGRSPPGPRPGPEAGRSYPASEASGGWEETPHVQGWGQPGETTFAPEARGCSWEEPPRPEARAGGREEQPEERWLSRHRRA